MLIGEPDAPKGHVRERLAAALLRLRRDDRGVTAVVLALTLSVLIGLAGLGAETGLWYTVKRVNQSAADTAALSGAFEVLAGQPYSDMCGFAKRDAARNGFVFASYTCPVSTPACTSPASGQMCANHPPVLGASTGNANAFEVILAQDQNSLLASLYLPSVTIGTRAVALISKLDDACLLALSPTAPNAIFIKGNPTLNMPNCSIVSDSSSPDAIHFQGNANVTADTLVSHGGITQTGGSATITLNLPAKTNQPAVSDPYASTLTHTLLTTGMPPTSALCTITVNNSTNVTTYDGTCAVSGASVGPPNNNGTVIMSGGNKRITGNWNIDHETVNLSPGTYWITDGNLNLGANGLLECTACDPATGAGITIIFTIGTGTTVGTFTAGANTHVGNPPTAPNFNAPGAGTFQDLLIIQDSNGLPGGTTWNTSGTFQGGPSTVLDGLVYFPKSDMTFNGNPSAGGTGCLLLVANTVTLSGDTKMTSTGCNGSASPPTVKTVALAE